MTSDHQLLQEPAVLYLSRQTLSCYKQRSEVYLILYHVEHIYSHIIRVLWLSSLKSCKNALLKEVLIIKPRNALLSFNLDQSKLH